MKLRKEENDEILEDSLEYKAALKSVIRYEIQNLLQKLATETGEESIVITTNVSTGTYNHLGSYLGREYLQDGGITVEMLCENFMRFCKSIQVDCEAIQDPERNNSLMEQVNSLTPQEFASAIIRNNAVSKQLSPSTKSAVNSHVRKRQLNKSPHVQDCPPSKRKNLIGSHSPGAVYESVNHNLLNDGNRNGTSLVKEDNPYLVQDKKASPEANNSVPWIKIEPADEYYTEMNPNCENSESQNKMNKNEIHDATSDFVDSDKPPKLNRRKNLIPLANIYKKFGNANKMKAESAPPQEDKPNSILRNLYENSPIYQISDLFSANSDSETTEKIPVSLPSNLAENLASEEFSGTTENLVLSGYYDSDVYPTYRHRQKHLLSKSGSEKKPPKEKMKDKPASSPNGSSSEHPALKTYESGGRLVYSCDVCKRELSHLTSYRRHMKLHTMERPHVCPICQKGFIRKYHCIDHLNKHHRGVRYDPETLKVLDLPASVENEEQQAYSPAELNMSEYNYTLDQSLAGSEAELSVNENIDQSASTMLSELAKSAAKLKQSENGKENLIQPNFLLGSLNESKENLSQSEGSGEVKPAEETSAGEERKPEKGTRKGGMPTALEKIVAELRSAPKNKHKKELSGKKLPDFDKLVEEIPAHLQKYADEENWICLLCDESFPVQSSFSSHMIGHKSAEIVNCNQCPRGFISKELYDEHLVTEHGEGEVNDMDI